jgi:hypothetical protein
MKRIQETATIGYSRYYLKPNSSNWRSFFVYTEDRKVYDMMTDLCSLPNIDEEISKHVERRDFNYVDEGSVGMIHAKHFSL